MENNKEVSARVLSSMKYNAKNVLQFKCSFNKKTDADIIEHLQSKENKQGYIKSLIRNDLKKGGKKSDS